MALFAKNRRFFSLFCTALFVLPVISLLTPAMAGQYHYTLTPTGSTIMCSQCHTMHGTQGGASLIYSGGGSGPQAKLLRFNSVLGLCLYCHRTGLDVGGGVSAPDIMGATAQTHIPSAGRFSDQAYDNYANMHDVGLSAPTPPGNNDSIGWAGVTSKYSSTFSCLYCHDHHGNANYRNLRYDPSNTANDTPGAGVTVTYTMSDSIATDVNNAGAGLSKYARNNVTFKRVTAGVPNKISAWCGRCHTKFYGISEPYTVGDGGPSYLGGTATGAVGLGDDNTGNPWSRHPVGDINIGATNMHTDVTNWTTGAIFTTGDPGNINRVRIADDTAAEAFSADDEPFCLSCHYAHGGGNPNNGLDPSLDHSNLVYTDSSNRVNIDPAYTPGTGSMRNTCLQCHNQ